MNKTKGPNKEKPFFVGYQKTPNRDRRFLLLSAPLLVAGIGGLGYLVAKRQRKPEPAVWGSRNVQRQGRLVKHPYPCLLVPNPNTAIGFDTALLVQPGKKGAMPLVRDLTSENINVSGKIISRDDVRYNYMLEIVDAIEAEDDLAITPDLPRELGTYKLRGRIQDSKCHFGVMRPALGMTHKACASLCVRGGVPPIFVPQTTKLDRVIIVLADDSPRGDGNNKASSVENSPVDAGVNDNQGSPVDVNPLLPYMSDLIQAEGKLRVINNHYEFLINPESIEVLVRCQV